VQNVETIASLRGRAEEELSHHQRRVERVTVALGHPHTIYVLALFVAGWVLWNALGRRLGLPTWDAPPFQGLQVVASVSALLMTIMVLTTQNRQSKQAEQRSHLDLQVNLLAEQKVAKLIELVEQLRRDMPEVPAREDPVAQSMTEPLDPKAALTALKETFEREATDRGANTERPADGREREVR
jgi:uncharacterized membrane protein